MAKYELLADVYHETTSKPGDPFTYVTHERGAKVELNAEQARRLIEAGAFRDPAAKDDRSAEPGADTVAPKGTADGVGDGDADEGTIGDGGPDPQATGSTVTGVGGGPADGQGNAAGNPAASVPADVVGSGATPSQGARSRRR